ncbi:MAG: hypothetical protein KBS74_00835 [Clostridiales bacterium]|nr:hypothetical protein [Candidatus Cacconaster stercorequi]
MTEEEAKKYFAELHNEPKRDDAPLSDEALENVTGGGTATVGGKEYTRVYSGTDCFKRFGSENWSGFQMAPYPNYFKHPAYWHWWVCSTKGECGCCQHLYIDGAGTGICWFEVNGAASWPPDYNDRR